MNRTLLPSPAATRAFGRRLARTLVPGEVLLLQGPIGAGKTTFLQGLAIGLGIRARVTSPTFVLHKQYRVTKHPSIRSLHHMDAYRLRTKKELLGALEDVDATPDAVWAIEWGGHVASLFSDRPTRVLEFSVTKKRGRVLTIRRPFLRP